MTNEPNHPPKNTPPQRNPAEPEGSAAPGASDISRADAPSGDLLPGLDRSIVLIGLMGAGKSCIGRKLAERLTLPFADADTEIEAAAGCSIPDIFRLYGEAAFRDGERRVMCRLMDSQVRVLATGGGAFMDTQTRRLIQERGIAVWLRADLDTLVRRTGRRSNRPLLQQGDPRKILADLIDRRYPVYAEAPVVVDSRDVPPDRTVDVVLEALRDHLARHHVTGGAKDHAAEETV